MTEHIYGGYAVRDGAPKGRHAKLEVVNDAGEVVVYFLYRPLCGACYHGAKVKAHAWINRRIHPDTR